MQPIRKTNAPALGARRLPAPRPLAHALKRQNPPATGESIGSEVQAMARHWVEAWKDVVRLHSIPQDVLAGITVAAVALPLNLALAVASGLPPSAGLIAGVVGGAIAATMGGTPLQVTGPAAALSTMVLALVAQFGVAGAVGATLVVGGVQLLLALGRAGKLMKFVPESVLAGFTTGVGLKLLDQQIPELLGIDYRVADLMRMMHEVKWLHEVSWLSAFSGLAVAFSWWPRAHLKRFPAAMVGMALVTFLASLPDWDIERVGERARPSLPAPSLPDLPTSAGWSSCSSAAARHPRRRRVAPVRAARSTAWRRQRSPTTPTSSCSARASPTSCAGFCGGMPVTGVVVRSGVNVQSGGKTRLAALFHAGVLAASSCFLSAQIAAGAAGGARGPPVRHRLPAGRGRDARRTSSQEHKLEASRSSSPRWARVTGHLMAGLVGGLAHPLGAIAGCTGQERARARQLGREEAEGHPRGARPREGRGAPPRARRATRRARRVAAATSVERPLDVASASFVHPAGDASSAAWCWATTCTSPPTRSVRADEGTPVPHRRQHQHPGRRGHPRPQGASG